MAEPATKRRRLLLEQERKGMQFITEAEKKVKSYHEVLIGETAKLEDAAGLYVRAGLSLKVAKNFAAAGDAYSSAAKLYRDKLDTPDKAADNFANAAAVYRKVNPEEAIMCYQTASKICTDIGQFSLAAKYHKETGELYEDKMVDLEGAIESYEQAADLYEGVDLTDLAKACTTKVAHILAQLQQFKKAAELFEEIAINCRLQYIANEFFFKSLICWFCHEPSMVPEKMEQYKGIHPVFDRAREQKLLQDLWQAFDEKDRDKFAERIEAYDSLKLDNWLAAQLLLIKKKI